MISSPFFRYVAGLLVCALLNACTTTQHLSSPSVASINSVVRVHDEVTCTLRDGSKRSFSVKAVENSMLRGESEVVALADVVQIDISRFSPGKTAMVISVILVAGLVAAVAHSPGAFVGGPAIGL